MTQGDTAGDTASDLVTRDNGLYRATRQLRCGYRILKAVHAQTNCLIGPEINPDGEAFRVFIYEVGSRI